MAREKTAPAEQEATEPKAPAKIRMRNTNATNGELGAIATPLKKDAAAWRATGWVDAD